MKRIWNGAWVKLLLIALAVVVAGCGAKTASNEGGAPSTGAAEGTEQAPAEETAAAEENSLAGKKIALIMQLNIGTFSSQYIDGVTEQVTKFGGEVQVFGADGDLAKMASNLEAAINQGFDGILIDHGQAGALEAGVKKALEKNIPVVAFDADLNVPGVTVLQQGDEKMAEMTLERLAQDAGGKGTIVKIWVAGFAPMERRQIAYSAFQQKYPEIKEIAAFGSASASTALDTQAQMEAILKQYPNKGDITAVWASWDEFAKGATRAIEQAGRNEIKVYGIDMSDEDLQMIQKADSPWVASAAVDPKDIGRVQVRYLYQKFHGDETPATVVLDPVFVHREQLPEQPISTAELSQYVEGWGSSEQGYADWMKDIEKQ
ncbi:sugar ABC transporter substrate-binding protein [Paenibacillus alkalitolerans]|uniref:sugar ABC transporter substrate-binding protein n=1 Tax=Paenibacillus alkalitolerans TaxID=2799335 RepID=UPI0018F54D60|nr:sugar ABC transporter substrate-binding protein [Paenibacillus alkalitolerans]